MTDSHKNKIKSPFNNDLFLGYISKVTSRNCDIHFPNVTLLQKFWHDGEEYAGGIIGNYVVIEGENHGFLGILQEVGLSKDDIYSLDKEPTNLRSLFHPDGKVEILLSFDFFDIRVKKGLEGFPIAGSKVYLCSKGFLNYLLSKADSRKEINGAVFDFATLNNSEDTNFEITPNSLFERHCAVVGTTGGGKSYTIAQLIQKLIDTNVKLGTKQKSILIDATGEFHRLSANNGVEIIYFGDSAKYSTIGHAKQTFFHYSKLRISDLVALLRPAGQVQRPKLIDAIKSLKMIKIIEKFSGDTTKPYLQQVSQLNGNLIKIGKDKGGFKKTYNEFVVEIDSETANFEISRLAQQVVEECVWDTDRNNQEKWGLAQDTERSNVSSLISRINHTLTEESFNSIFKFRTVDAQGNFIDTSNYADEFRNRVNAFLTNEKSVLLISVESVSFEFGLREILINSIGRLLLEKARKRELIYNPLILFLDEAHQFLNKSIKDEHFAELELDAFDKIAKECRKHGLYLCISTQMPRDIPDGTLSQMGTFIVHRLINEKDREKIQNACSEANRQCLSYLPIMGEGVALLISVNLPMPVIIKVKKPIIEPDSKSPSLFKVIRS